MLWALEGICDRRNLPHSHHMHEIFLCLSDTGTQWCADKEYPFKYGDLYFFPSGFPHQVWADIQHPAHFSLICFDPAHFEGISPEETRAIPSRLQEAKHYHFDSKTGQWEGKMQAIVAECNNPAPFHNQKTSLLLANLLIDMYRVTFNQYEPAENLKGKIELCVKEIGKHPENEYSIDSFAASLAMSRSLFTKRFKEYTGSSLVKYVQSARLKRAMALLADVDCSVSEAAWKSGFSNLSYFHRIFRDSTSITPGEFRKFVKDKGTFPRVL